MRFTDTEFRVCISRVSGWRVSCVGWIVETFRCQHPTELIIGAEPPPLAVVVESELEAGSANDVVSHPCARRDLRSCFRHDVGRGLPPIA